ncbi:hypothetical protein D3C80_1458260 [compost metagenome]
MTMHHGDACLRVALEFAISLAQLVEHRQVKGIALGCAVKADQHDVATQFTADVAWARFGHGAIPRAGRGQG